MRGGAAEEDAAYKVLQVARLIEIGVCRLVYSERERGPKSLTLENARRFCVKCHMACGKARQDRALGGSSRRRSSGVDYKRININP